MSATSCGSDVILLVPPCRIQEAAERGAFFAVVATAPDDGWLIVDRLTGRRATGDLPKPKTAVQLAICAREFFGHRVALSANEIQWGREAVLRDPRANVPDKVFVGHAWRKMIADYQASLRWFTGSLPDVLPQRGGGRWQEPNHPR